MTSTVNISRKKVVVIGGGYAGIAAASALDDVADVTLIDRKAAFFHRVDPTHARAAVADLEKMAAEEALPADFIDPGEDHAFNPEVMDGECAS